MKHLSSVESSDAALDTGNAIIDVEALKRVENRTRRRIASKPDDMQARVRLAWCLFMQALHQAGREHMLTALVEMGDGNSVPPGNRLQTLLDRDARCLLQDCLRQTIAVSQLSSDPGDHRDVEKLKALVRLFGGEKALSDTDDEAVKILEEIVQAVIDTPDIPASYNHTGLPKQ